MDICNSCDNNDDCIFKRSDIKDCSRHTDRESLPVNTEDICNLKTVDIKMQGHVEDLKTKRNRLIDEAAKVAQEYARSCDIGPERNRAFDCYEAVLYSTMEGVK